MGKKHSKGFRGVFDTAYWRVNENRVVVVSASDKTTNDPVVVARKEKPFHLSQTQIQSGLYGYRCLQIGVTTENSRTYLLKKIQH